MPQLDLLARPGQLVFNTFVSSSSYPSKIPTVTEPANDGVYDLLNHNIGIVVPQFHKIWPLGLSADNDAFSMRILGWHSIGNVDGGILWWPTIICEVACIMGASVGVAASPVLNTVAFCDTITLVSQGVEYGLSGATVTTFGNITIWSPGSDLIGFIIIPTLGFQKLEFTFDQTTNTPTSNVIISGL